MLRPWLLSSKSGLPHLRVADATRVRSRNVQRGVLT
jgi:hypothetical protein